MSILPENDVCPLQLEIDQGCGELKIYANVFSLPFDYDSVVVHVRTCDGFYTFEGNVLEGGQRVLLPQEVANLIIRSLLEQNTVEIQIGRYRSLITPEGFSKKYRILAES